MRAKDKERLIEGLRELVKEDEETLRKRRRLLGLLHLLPAMRGIKGVYEIDGLGDFDFVVAWDDLVYQRAISETLDAGWVERFGGEVVDLARERKYTTYVHSEIDDELIWFRVIARADLDGATCKIQQIGETKEIKEVVTPIFEVTCPEAENPLMPAQEVEVNDDRPI